MFASASRGARGRGGWRVTAPIAGVVDDVAVTPGEAVDANDLLLRIVDPARRWLSARVPESWAPRMRPERGVSFRLLGEESWRPLRGSLVNVARSVDSRSRTVQVIWALEDAAPELRVGASAEVAIPIGEPTEAVVVPRAALLDAEGRAVVIVQREGEAFEERAVRTGAADGGRVAILEGLSAGERVVTRGGYLVRLAARAAEGGAASHGHVH
jgi:RND family efflux transporter MFP subunit